MSFIIDNNIPMPAASVGMRKKAAKFPLEQMTSGQSFFIPETDIKMRRGIKSALTRFANRINVEVRHVEDEEGIRVWRV